MTYDGTRHPHGGVVPAKKKTPTEPMRIVYAKDSSFRALDRATRGMTPQERSAFVRDMMRYIEATKDAQPEAKSTALKGDGEPEPEAASSKANAIFRRMAKLPTPMAPEVDPHLGIGSKAKRKQPK